MLIFDARLSKEWEQETQKFLKLTTRKRVKPLSVFYWRMANRRNHSGGWPERSDHE